MNGVKLGFPFVSWALFGLIFNKLGFDLLVDQIVKYIYSYLTNNLCVIVIRVKHYFLDN